jgi:hypothetical protein
VIDINYGDDLSSILEIGDGMALVPTFQALIEQDDELQWGSDRESKLWMKVDWNAEKFTYEITQMLVAVEPGGDPISGTTLRSVPVKWILKMCINRALLVRSSDGSTAPFTSLHNELVRDQDVARRLADQGPKPETLAWVARIYTVAKIKLDPPSQIVAEFLEVPPRTASHWIKLARERGHLSI